MKVILITSGIIIGLVMLWVVCFVLYARRQKRKQQILNTLSLTLPKCWRDFSEVQFLYVANLLVQNNTETEIRTKCFLYFSEIKVLYEKSPGIWMCRRNKERLALEESVIQYFADRFLFVTQKLTEVKPLSDIAGHQPVNSQLRGVPFSLWMAAENYYQAFLFTQKETFLYSLCATIYSLDSYEDISEFRDSETQERVKDFSGISQAELYTCFIVYSGVKHVLSIEFPYLFEKSSDVANREVKQPPKMREMFDNMIYTLNGGDVTKYDDVVATECWKVFDTLNRKAKENKEMQERLSKMKKK